MGQQNHKNCEPALSAKKALLKESPLKEGVSCRKGPVFVQMSVLFKLWVNCWAGSWLLNAQTCDLHIHHHHGRHHSLHLHILLHRGQKKNYWTSLTSGQWGLQNYKFQLYSVTFTSERYFFFFIHDIFYMIFRELIWYYTIFSKHKFGKQFVFFSKCAFWRLAPIGKKAHMLSFFGDLILSS